MNLKKELKLNNRLQFNKFKLNKYILRKMPKLKTVMNTLLNLPKDKLKQSNQLLVKLNKTTNKKYKQSLRNCLLKTHRPNLNKPTLTIKIRKLN